MIPLCIFVTIHAGWLALASAAVAWDDSAMLPKKPSETGAMSGDNQFEIKYQKIASVPSVLQIQQIIESPNHSDVIVIGSRGAATISIKTLQVTKTIVYAAPANAVGSYFWRGVDLDGDKVLEYIQCGGDSRVRELMTYNADGSLRWRCPLALDMSGFGGINWVLPVRREDGSIYLFAGSRSDDRVYMVDRDGQIKSKHKWGKISSFETVMTHCDLNEDGSDEIIYGIESDVICRNAQGEQLWTYSMKDRGNYINGIYRAPMLDADKTKGFSIRIAKKANTSRAYYRLSLEKPYVSFVTDANDKTEGLLANILISKSAGPESVWVAPAITRKETLVVQGKTEGGLFMRVFDAKYKPLDGLGAILDKPVRDTHYLPHTKCATASIEGSDLLGVFIPTKDTEVSLFTFKRMSDVKPAP